MIILSIGSVVMFCFAVVSLVVAAGASLVEARR